MRRLAINLVAALFICIGGLQLTSAAAQSPSPLPQIPDPQTTAAECDDDGPRGKICVEVEFPDGTEVCACYGDSGDDDDGSGGN